MKTFWKRASMVAAVVAVLALLWWALTPTPMPVETARVEAGPLRTTVDADGKLRAHDSYQIAAPSAGKLMRIALREGDAVKRDQVVAGIAPLPLSEREREEQTARVASAAALESAAQEQVRNAQAEFEQATRERQRIDQLVQSKFVSPQAAEQSRTVESTKKSAVEAARLRARSAADDVRAARAGLQVAATGPLINVRSPVPGSVLRINEKSERIVTAGTPLLVVGDPSRYEIVVDVLTTEAVKVKPGMTMWLNNWGGDKSLKAVVRLIEPAAFTKISALGIEEQRVNIIADFVDPPGALSEGYRVEASVVTWESDKVLQVPIDSLFRNGSGWGVFVVDGGRVHKRSVEIGKRSSTQAAIVRGIDAGAVILRHPANQLEDGARVRVREGNHAG